jgi:hypothetical protein
VRHLQEARLKQTVNAPQYGLITTPRLKEKIGQYLREGDLICVLEQLSDHPSNTSLEVEVCLAEQDVARVRSGQEVILKARGLPFKRSQPDSSGRLPWPNEASHKAHSWLIAGSIRPRPSFGPT